MWAIKNRMRVRIERVIEGWKVNGDYHGPYSHGLLKITLHHGIENGKEVRSDGSILNYRIGRRIGHQKSFGIYTIAAGPRLSGIGYSKKIET